MLLWIFDSNLEEPVIGENSGYREKYNKYVLNSEIYTAVETNNTLKPLFFNEPPMKPDLEVKNFTGSSDPKPKNHLLKRILNFLKQGLSSPGM